MYISWHGDAETFWIYCINGSGGWEGSCGVLFTESMKYRGTPHPHFFSEDSIWDVTEFYMDYKENGEMFLTGPERTTRRTCIIAQVHWPMRFLSHILWEQQNNPTPQWTLHSNVTPFLPAISKAKLEPLSNVDS